MALSLHAPSVECGGTVAGTAAWTGDGSAEVSLRWATSGDGTVDTGIVDTAHLSGGDASFELTVPDDGPMTFAGKLMSLRWDVVLDVGDSTESVAVTVLPRGGLTVWVRKTAPPPQA